VLIKQSDFILEVVEGEGLDKIKATIDFEKMHIIFQGYDSAWRCGTCRFFVHPLQYKLKVHNRAAHPYESLSLGKVNGNFRFTRQQITYVENDN